MNSLATTHRNPASHRTAVDRDALAHLLDRHALQSRQLADNLFATAAARDPQVAAERTRIGIARARMERRSNIGAVAGVGLTVAMVATLSLVMQMPVVDQLARILAAGVVLTLFALLTRPTRGFLGLLMPLHLAMCLALLGKGGWMAADGAGSWDFALLVLGMAAGFASWFRDRAARALDLDEAELVLKAKGRGERLDSVRRWADAAI
jgi:hypothetical protein